MMEQKYNKFCVQPVCEEFKRTATMYGPLNFQAPKNILAAQNQLKGCVLDVQYKQVQNNRSSCMDDATGMSKQEAVLEVAKQVQQKLSLVQVQAALQVLASQGFHVSNINVNQNQTPLANQKIPTGEQPANKQQQLRTEHQRIGNKLYQTEMCRSFEETGFCKYGNKCQFAHGAEELRSTKKHPKHKTVPCQTILKGGVCPYGKRCTFLHPSDIQEMASVDKEQNKQVCHRLPIFQSLTEQKN